jgi:hypothetical protein
MYGTELGLERPDPSEAGLKLGLANSPFPERSLDGCLFCEDHVAQPLRLARHVVKHPLYRPDLVEAQREPALSRRIEHVTGPRIAVQLGRPGKGHPAPFA